MAANTEKTRQKSMKCRANQLPINFCILKRVQQQDAWECSICSKRDCWQLHKQEICYCLWYILRWSGHMEQIGRWRGTLWCFWCSAHTTCSVLWLIQVACTKSHYIVVFSLGTLSHHEWWQCKKSRLLRYIDQAHGKWFVEWEMHYCYLRLACARRTETY